MSSRIALITGASGALGSVVTPAFLDAGWRVAGVSRSPGTRSNFEAFPADLASAESTAAVVAEVRERMGGLHAVVHLAGGWSGGSRAEDTDPAEFDRMFDMNLRTALHVFQPAARWMRAEGFGRLLAVGSRAAVEPQENAAAYSVSKAALVALVRSFARELEGSGVTANAVLPGTIDTAPNRAAMPDADRRQWVDPRHIAALLVHLASENAGHISGAAIPVFGGGAPGDHH